MSINSITRRGQRTAARTMQDRCVIRRRIGSFTDPVTGAVEGTWETVYEGATKVQSNRVAPMQRDVAGHQYTTAQVTLFLPVGGEARKVQSGDVAEIVASFNPDLVGSKFSLRVDDLKSFQTAVRFNASEVVS